MRSLGYGLVLGGVLWSVGCGADDVVDIVAECRAVGEPVDLARSSSASVFYPSVGRVDGHRFVTWHAMDTDQASMVPLRATVWGRWFDPSFGAAEDPINLGDSYYLVRQRWVPYRGGLVAQHWAEHPEAAADDMPVTFLRNLFVATVTPDRPDEAELDHVSFDAMAYCDGCPRMSNSANMLDPGPGPLATVVAGGEPLVAFAGLPWECRSVFINYQRLFLGNADRGAEPVALGGELCPEDHALAHSIAVSNPWLFHRVGGAGILFRFGGEPSDGRLHYARLDDTGRPIGEVRRVGRYKDFWTSSEGLLPRAIELPGGSVLFSEQVRATPERCFRLRIMDADGTDVRDAPWQIPCPESGDGSDRMTHYVEMEPSPFGGLVVWSERSGNTRSTFESAEGYEDGVYAVIVTEDGKRGSDVVELTPPDATLLKPGVGGYVAQGAYMPVVAAEGPEATVVWQQADGAIYGRDIRCDAAR